MDKHPITKEDPEERIRSLVQTCATMQMEIEALEAELEAVVRRMCRGQGDARADSEVRAAMNRVTDRMLIRAEPGSRLQ